MIGGLLAEIIGYRSCFFLSAAMMLFATVIVVKVTVEDPSTYGVALVEQRKREKQRKKEESLKKGIAVRTFTPLVLGLFTVLFLQRMCRFVFTPFLALYVQQVRGTLEWASGITGIINGCICIATAVSSVTLVRIADRHDKIKLIFLYAVICLPISLFLIPDFSLVFFVVGYTLYYFVIGAIEPIITAALSEHTSPEGRGALFGWIGTFQNLAGIFGPLLGSLISAIFGGYQAILTSISVMVLIVIAAIIILRRTLSRHPEEESV